MEDLLHNIHSLGNPSASVSLCVIPFFLAYYYLIEEKVQGSRVHPSQEGEIIINNRQKVNPRWSSDGEGKAPEELLLLPLLRTREADLTARQRHL